MATSPLQPGYARANTPYGLFPSDIGTPALRLAPSRASLASAAARPVLPLRPTYPGQGARTAALLALEPRCEIEAAIVALIATLDARDGDTDMEDDDPAGTALDAGEAAATTRFAWEGC